MSWWLNIIEYLRSPENGSGNGNFSFKKTIIKALAESAVDFLYYAVGFFTSLYFFSAVYLFFISGGGYRDILVKIFDALSEPYLGSVGIYVILKEVRKRNLRVRSKHFGEYFVLAWSILFLISAVLVFFRPEFTFDTLMSDITTITLALVVIYTGGLIHKP
ncbi:MAG: hypothetical protein UV62_C0020G0009 [Parcubacteria group bacterium GW2011_GWC1_43_11]|nr:MAG: hypothetical protein UV62_C0020G0009 [Parcubacteria group bacterium GW2011_GWC1_43_11]